MYKLNTKTIAIGYHYDIIVMVFVSLIRMKGFVHYDSINSFDAAVYGDQGTI